MEIACNLNPILYLGTGLTFNSHRKKAILQYF